MAQYQNQQSTATPAANDTLNHIVGSATARPNLCELMIGSSANPTEQTSKFTIVRTTTAGTTPAGNTTVTERDPLGPAAGCTVGGGGYSTEPTVGETLWVFDVHQKTTFRWVAYPGREFCGTASANNGVGLVVIAQSAAYALDSAVAWLE